MYLQCGVKGWKDVEIICMGSAVLFARHGGNSMHRMKRVVSVD